MELIFLNVLSIIICRQLKIIPILCRYSFTAITYVHVVVDMN